MSFLKRPLYFYRLLQPTSLGPPFVYNLLNIHNPFVNTCKKLHDPLLPKLLQRVYMDIIPFLYSHFYKYFPCMQMKH